MPTNTNNAPETSKIDSTETMSARGPNKRIATGMALEVIICTREYPTHQCGFYVFLDQNRLGGNDDRQEKPAIPMMAR